MVELLIVVSIGLVLLGMLTPHLLRARRAAEYASAFASVREISRAEELYSLTYGKGYSLLLPLGGANPCYASPETACVLDETLAHGRKDAYTFTIRLSESTGPATAYEIVAIPDSGALPQLSVCANRAGAPGPCRLTPSPGASGLDRAEAIGSNEPLKLH